MELHYILGDYHYTETDWEGLPPDEVRDLLANHFGQTEMKAKLWALYERFLPRCRDYLIGRNRIAFMFNTYVVKLPWSDDGFGDNDWEGSVSNDPTSPDNEWNIQYARTRLHYEGEIPVLFMERVQPLTTKGIVDRFGAEPEWVMSVDCGQVGINRQGRLVAYDYGYN